MLYTTFKLLREAEACESSYKKLRKALAGVQADDLIALTTILDSNGLDDALWALRATTTNCDRFARLLTADFAEQVLPIWTAAYPTDNRIELCIQAARNFANGLIDEQQLAAARAAAWAAWAAARAAAGAAWAAREKQSLHFRASLEAHQQ